MTYSYVCLLCSESFDTAERWKHHLETNHDVKRGQFP